MTDPRDVLLAHRDALLSKLAALSPAPDVRGDKYDVASAAEAHDALAVRRSTLTRALREVDGAIRRVAEGTYSRCADCDGAISDARLKVMPCVETCVRCAARRERTRSAIPPTN